jgi:sarcosine oxidase subunit gamma
MADGARHSPLEADAGRLRRVSDEDLSVAELPFLSQIDLRTDLAVPGLLETITGVLGVALPTEPNKVAGSRSLAALWLGPFEWLVAADETLAAGLVERLERTLPRGDVTLVDVSAARTTIEISGRHARPLLEAGCSIDLHPHSFGGGACAQTYLGRVNVILWQVTDEPRYRLLVRPSVAHHLAVWLIDAIEGLSYWR